ncbi:MAG: hypothetical protein JSR85_04960 [Proteobacteria bacterium]|nr:hypothetical protein [Pseudomonadota bacterium]
MRASQTTEKLLRPDSKGRISLGKMAEGVSGFRAIYNKGSHQIILEPYAEIPLQEKWLFENEEALKRVKKGLLESSKGQLNDRGSFAKYIKEK